MDKDKALPAGSGMWMFANTPKRYTDRYHHEDIFTGLSTSPPPNITREPPKITLRKSKFHTLLSGQHAPSIPEEGTDNSVKSQSKEFHAVSTTSSSENVTKMKKCSSSPSLSSLGVEPEENRISGEIIRHQLNAVTTDRHDLSAPHSSIETSPSSLAVLKMFEKASGKNVFEDHNNMGLMKREGKLLKSQSVPVSPSTSPKLRQRNLSGDRGGSEGQKSLMQSIMGRFTPSIEPEAAHSISDEISEHKSVSTNPVNLFYQWGTTSKVKVDHKDLNMFAPTST